MIDILSKSQIKSLMEIQTGPCVSIFLPTHRAGAETKQDPIRLRNLLRQAGTSLAASGLKPAAVKELLKPAVKLIDDHSFWQHQSDGLALFLCQGSFSSFRLPLGFQELEVVASRFHLKPLLSFIQGNGHFFVLALSQNHVKLYHATDYTMSDVGLEGVPESLRHALRARPSESELQYHTAAAGSTGGRPPIYHGHGTGAEDQKTKLLQFFRQINRGLADLLQHDQAPLVVATVDYLFPLYREANTHSSLVETPISGNPDESTISELHSKARTIVEPLFTAERSKARKQYEELSATEQTTNDLATVLREAHYGKIEFLFVPIGIQRWGKWDQIARSIELHEKPGADGEDLLNLAALLSYANGSKVYAVPPDQMPNMELVAARLRP